MVLPTGKFFDRGRKSFDKNVYGRFRNDHYRVRPFSTIKSGFDIDWRFLNGFYRLVKIDRGRKPSGFKAHIRFRGYPYRVRPYSTTECDLNIDKRF